MGPGEGPRVYISEDSQVMLMPLGALLPGP